MEAGQSVTGAFEGWFQNPDGTYSLLVGYYNRNTKQELDVPIGPDNRIDPGGPDQGQPTHFLPGRGWGIFTIKVPKDFGEKKLTWTLVANGKPTSIKLWLNTVYEVSPFIASADVGPDADTPPTLRFQDFKEQGPMIQGPQGLSTKRSATVNTPLPLTVWVSDDAKWSSNSGAKPRNLSPIPVTVTWTKYRGPGTVTFSKAKPVVEKLDSGDAKFVFNGKATTEAQFSEPGEYILHVTINDYSGEGGGGGFQCCWSNGTVAVSVKP
ncbi:MAG TPA: hypothetical protein VEV17_16260 [Bryobacteraceae bacterium]|nr:hypothetical protein [Bryobacteraceae bacterium]